VYSTSSFTLFSEYLFIPGQYTENHFVNIYEF
jgi:hypothetical protein